MDHEALQHKLTVLASLGGRKDSIEKLGQTLQRLDDWDLIRLNPLRLAEEEGFNPSEAVDLFVLGAKAGLFDFVWNTICPHCANIAFQCEKLDNIPEDFFCLVCHWDVANRIDEEVETAFGINPAVKQVDIDPFRDIDSYWRYFFSPNFKLAPELVSYIEQMKLDFLSAPPDDSGEIVFDGELGKSYRLVSLDKHSVFFIGIAENNGDTGPSRIDVEVLPDGFSKQRVDLPPGKITVQLKNLGSNLAGALLLTSDLDGFYRVMVDYPAEPLPFLTGKMLLNNQTFRDQFRITRLRPDLKLNIRSLTVLFTDLQGSTALYDREGDGVAYELIQEHFKLLTEATRAYDGAVVKTIGDAVMATFSSPRQGLQAALEMMAKIRRFNETLPEDQALGLKVGLHEGPTLAVNANDRLDYFGQTVNIAARVQCLAKAGEVWFTEPMLEAAEAVAGPVPEEKRCSVKLKGVGEDTVVYCIPEL